MSRKSNIDSNGNASVPPQENGYNDSFSLLSAEKAVQELIQQPLDQGIDDHLFEFSEALRTVAKALRRVAEGKATAQAEATEWKRKYELERERNIQLEQKVSEEHHREDSHESADKFADQPVLFDEAAKESQRCCGKNGICSHEVLRDGELDRNCSSAQSKIMRKASFKLSWWCKGDKSDQHKHDIVSFEKGNITTAERSSRQMVERAEKS